MGHLSLLRWSLLMPGAGDVFFQLPSTAVSIFLSPYGIERIDSGFQGLDLQTLKHKSPYRSIKKANSLQWFLKSL